MCCAGSDARFPFYQWQEDSVCGKRKRKHRRSVSSKELRFPGDVMTPGPGALENHHTSERVGGTTKLEGYTSKASEENARDSTEQRNGDSTLPSLTVIYLVLQSLCLQRCQIKHQVVQNLSPGVKMTSTYLSMFYQL
ncbi:hypothetical protein AV530_005378 [Patagioenas fasciata monilis]|uniref:Uncharacterized protein n=1 Tax=Patagioenas fasciata monilis TaxID=372326 RepID=A0A1V4JL34_PATFA|nr:hypothetical protein AV530_005378 [Patagioenas fasciata monilis]